MATTLAVGGITPLSTIDFPDHLAAVVFCQGCPWRCRYCQNPHLLPPRSTSTIPWAQVRAFLQRRRGFLEAVVFSGGEPTMQPAIVAVVTEVREMGFLVGLETAGPYPSRLARILPFLDWVGLDIKAPFQRYAQVTGVPGSGQRTLASARLILESGIDCEFRTTVHPLLLTHEILLALAQALAELGVKRYVLQEFRPQGCADEILRRYPVNGFLDEKLCKEISAHFPFFSVRRAGPEA